MVTREVAGSVGEQDRENTDLLVMIYVLEMYNNQPKCAMEAASSVTSLRFRRATRLLYTRIDDTIRLRLPTHKK
jgi:hypothetical protein